MVFLLVLAPAVRAHADLSGTWLGIGSAGELGHRIGETDRGQHKVVAEGSFLDSCNDHIYYIDLDILVGSSGAGVLNRHGYVVGVHTDGDCEAGGTNYGWTAASIVAASPYLQDGDLADLDPAVHE